MLSDPFQKMFVNSCSVSTWTDLITFVYSIDYNTLHWTFYNMQNESHCRIVNFLNYPSKSSYIKGLKKICLLLSNSFYKGQKTYIHQIYFKDITPFKTLKKWRICIKFDTTLDGNFCQGSSVSHLGLSKTVLNVVK